MKSFTVTRVLTVAQYEVTTVKATDEAEARRIADNDECDDLVWETNCFKDNILDCQILSSEPEE